MILSEILQAELLHDAARLSGMDGHIQNCGHTCAERVMQMLGGKRNTPRKTSYLYLDSVDACFYYQNDVANVTFSARWFESSADLQEDKIIYAIGLIKEMLKTMNALYKAEQEKGK